MPSPTVHLAMCTGTQVQAQELALQSSQSLPWVTACGITIDGNFTSGSVEPDLGEGASRDDWYANPAHCVDCALGLMDLGWTPRAPQWAGGA